MDVKPRYGFHVYLCVFNVFFHFKFFRDLFLGGKLHFSRVVPCSLHCLLRTTELLWKILADFMVSQELEQVLVNYVSRMSFVFINIYIFVLLLGLCNTNVKLFYEVKEGICGKRISKLDVKLSKLDGKTRKDLLNKINFKDLAAGTFLAQTDEEQGVVVDFC